MSKQISHAAAYVKATFKLSKTPPYAESPSNRAMQSVHPRSPHNYALCLIRFRHIRFQNLKRSNLIEPKYFRLPQPLTPTLSFLSFCFSSLVTQLQPYDDPAVAGSKPTTGRLYLFFPLFFQLSIFSSLCLSCFLLVIALFNCNNKL